MKEMKDKTIIIAIMFLMMFMMPINTNADYVPEKEDFTLEAGESKGFSVDVPDYIQTVIIEFNATEDVICYVFDNKENYDDSLEQLTNSETTELEIIFNGGAIDKKEYFEVFDCTEDFEEFYLIISNWDRHVEVSVHLEITRTLLLDEITTPNDGENSWFFITFLITLGLGISILYYCLKYLNKKYKLKPTRTH